MDQKVLFRKRIFFNEKKKKEKEKTKSPSTDHLRASNIVETSPEKLPLSTMVKAVANLLQATLFLAKTKQTKTLTQTKR